MPDTVTLAATMTFSRKDYEKAKALLNYSMADEDKGVPTDEFFTGDQVIDLNLSLLMAAQHDTTSDQLCFAMMLFMTAAQEMKAPSKSKWQQRMDDAKSKH